MKRDIWSAKQCNKRWSEFEFCSIATVLEASIMAVSSVTLIRLLSILLTNSPRDDTNPIPDIVQEPKSPIALYNHLSVMLNTGRPSSQVIAVTGFSGSDNMSFTIAISSNSTNRIRDRHFSIGKVGPPPKPITADQVIQDADEKCVHTGCLERIHSLIILQGFQGRPSYR